MKKSQIRLRIIALLAAALSSSAHAHQSDRPFLTLGTEVSAPRGFVEMCRADRSFCTPGQADLPGDSALVTAALSGFGQGHRPAVGNPVESALPAGSAIDIALGAVDASAALRLDMADAESLGAPVWAPLRSTIAMDVAETGWSRGAEAAANLRFPWQAAPMPTPDQWPRSADAPGDLKTVLERVNRFVNERVQQRTDMEVYGRQEYWHRSGVGRGAAGDCEDIAIEKRFELLQAGVPADRLYFAVVYERDIGLHAVLLARTADGDYVLDSRTPYINRWDRTAYSFVTVQSTREPMRWFALGEAPAEMARAAPPLTVG